MVSEATKFNESQKADEDIKQQLTPAFSFYKPTKFILSGFAVKIPVIAEEESLY